MKIIDLLNKIANDEKVPKKIQILNCVYIWHQGLKTYNVYEPVYGDLEFGDFYTHDLLNKEVEIIEDAPKEESKIPEKLEIEDDGNTITLFGEKENDWTILDNVDVIICNKINSIIDYLKNKGE